MSKSLNSQFAPIAVATNWKLCVKRCSSVARLVEMSTILQGDRRIVTQLPTVTLLNPQQNNPTLITQCAQATMRQIAY